MAVPTTALNENTPAGSDQINAGDNRIREYKVQNREVMAVDHDYPTSGSTATAGQHKKVTLQEQADLGTGAEGLPILGAQTVDGKAECVFTDEDDNDIPLTIKGTPVAINSCTAKTEPIDDDLLLLCDSEDSYKSKKLTLANLMNVIYPVGSVVTFGVSTNPATLFGVGTWTAIEGRVIVGIQSSGTFDTLNELLGDETITLTSAQSGLPAHTHAIGVNNSAGSNTGVNANSANNGASIQTGSNSAANAAEAHSNLQPSITKYVWERII